MHPPHDPSVNMRTAYEDFWAVVDAGPADFPARDNSDHVPADPYAEFLAIVDA